MNALSRFILASAIALVSTAGPAGPGTDPSAGPPPRAVPRERAIRVRLLPDLTCLLVPSGWDGARERTVLEGLIHLHAAAARPGPVPTREMLWRQVGDLERYLVDHPDSPYNPSVRIALGRFYQAVFRPSAARRHWAEAWAETRAFGSGVGKALADEALARGARLLVLQGAFSELEQLLEEAGDRPLDGGPLSQMHARTMEKLRRVRRDPAGSYKCGVLALDQLALVVSPSGYRREAFLDVASPEGGFDLPALAGLAARHGFPVRPVARVAAGVIPVPSVAHLGYGHFVTLVDRDGERIRVVDTGAKQSFWVHAEDLETELSGYYLVDARASGAELRAVPESEGREIRGSFLSCPPTDADDCPLVFGCSSGGGPGGGPGRGGRGGSSPPGSDAGSGGTQRALGGGTGRIIGPGRPGGCDPCGITRGNFSVGMIDWEVSEPHLNLWLHDTPLAYPTHRGSGVAFGLGFKQRDEGGLWSFPFFAHYGPEYTGYGPVMTTVGKSWHSSWTGVAMVPWENPSRSWTAEVFRPGGGLLRYVFPAGGDTSEVHYRDNSWAEAERDAGPARNLVALHIHFPDGSSWRFGHRNEGLAPGCLFLTGLLDPAGHATTLQYDPSATELVALKHVVDPDGGTNTVVRDIAGHRPHLITGVVGPRGETVTLGYNAEDQLVSITDAVGIVSEIGGYDPDGWPRWIRTPYGRTEFHLQTALAYGVGGWVDRAVTVRHPDGVSEAFALYDRLEPGVQIPDRFDVLPVSPLNTLEGDRRNERNTVHWGRQQFPRLATTNLATMTWPDIRQGRIRHWLNIPGYDGDYNHVDTLAHEQEPSPDGLTEGSVTFHDHDGKTSTRTRGAQVLPGVVTRLMPDGTTRYTRLERNPLGNITRTIERWSEGGGVRYRTNTYAFDANGVDLLVHRGPEGGVELGLAYDPVHPHLPVRLTNALGEVTRRTYNGSHQLVSETAPSGRVTRHDYDAAQRRIRTVVLHGNVPVSTNQFTWEGGRIRTQTDTRGFTRTRTWDALGRPLRVDYSDGSSERFLYSFQPGHGYASAAEAYPGGNGSIQLLDATAMVDRSGLTNFVTWDSLRRVAFRRDARGTLTAYQYCDCGSPSEVTVGSGLPGLAETTRHTYDGQGRLVSTESPDGGVRTLVHDLAGRVVRSFDGSGWTTNQWDNLDRLTGVFSAAGPVMEAVYDLHDLPVRETDARRVSVTNAWDSVHRLVASASASGVRTFAYAPGQDSPLVEVDELGNRVRRDRDASGRPTNEVFLELRGGIPVAVSTNRHAYDGAGAPTDLWDGNGRRTRWIRDAQGRVAVQIGANGVTNLVLHHDALGRLTNRWTPVRGNTRYSYDAAGGLLRVDYPASPDLHFAYDALGRITNMVDGVGVTRFIHAPGRLAAEDGPWASDTVAWDRDASGRPAALRVQQTSGTWWTNRYAWDPAGRLVSVTGPAGTFGYAYRDAGRVPSGIGSSAGSVTNLHDAAGRLVLTAWRSPSGAVVNAHGYAHDAAGRRVRQFRTNTVAGASHTVEYGHDSLGQLVRSVATHNATGLAVAGEQIGYAHDPGGNLVVRTQGTAAVGYGVDVMNRITGDGGTYGYLHDSDGNRTGRLASGSRAVWMSYDDENQLIRQETDTHYTPEAARFRVEFSYDGRLRLRERREYRWQGGGWYPTATVRYLYDGMLLVQERSTSAATVAYTRGVDLSGTLDGAGGIGGLLARSHGFQASTGGWTVHNAYHADAGGNVTAMFAVSGGAQVAWYRYDPFGRLLQASGTLASANRLRFSGKPWLAPEIDDGAGLYYFGFRFYDPQTQRWITRDPIGERGGINLYAMVGNGPVDAVDLFGLSLFDEKGAQRQLALCGVKPSCSEEDKVPIWVCNRKLQGEQGPFPRIGPLSHSFVACDDPTTTPPNRIRAYGMQPRALGAGGSRFFGPGHISPEPFVDEASTFANCRRKLVCPEDRDRQCQEGQTDSRYILFSPLNNCHAWANGRCK